MARELKMCVLQFKAGGLIWAKRSPDVTGVVREVLKAAYRSQEAIDLSMTCTYGSLDSLRS